MARSDGGTFLIDGGQRRMAAICLLAAAASSAAGPIPLTDLGAGLYLNQYEGGLYPGGVNTPPGSHHNLGVSLGNSIGPLDALGQPNADGRIGLVSIGLSNTHLEYQRFAAFAEADGRVEHDALRIVDGAIGGQPAGAWVSPDSANYGFVSDRLAAAGLTEQQVQAAWLKTANGGPTVSLPHPNADAFELLGHLGDIVRAMKVRYPNLQQVFVSSRIYAGYATTPLNPEPFAYESGFAFNWLIKAQIRQRATGEIDPIAGNLSAGVAPWLAWGPYLWADGLNPRSDGLTWSPDEYADDGTHPNDAGAIKVGQQLLDFFLESPYTTPWFVDRSALVGDVNRDGRVDARDIDIVQYNVGSTNPALDLDGSGGPSDAADLSMLIETILGTTFGDLNLDGQVDVTDLSRMAGHFGQQGGWSSGDMTGDRQVTIADLGVLARYFDGASGGASLAATLVVPEPATIAILAVSLAMLGRRAASAMPVSASRR